VRRLLNVWRLLKLISAHQLRASWGRTLLVIGGIATGVSLIVAIDVLNTSVLANFQSTIAELAGPAALEVTLGVGEVGFPETTVDVVAGDHDVAAAVPLVRGTIALADDPSDTLQLFGADLAAEEDLHRYRVESATSRTEALRALEDPHSIFLTTEFAADHHLALGGRVKLSTPEGVVEFTVRGLLVTEGLAKLLEGRLAVMDLPAAQMLLGKGDRVDQIDVVLRDGADVETVQRRLQAALPAALTVVPPAHRWALYEKILASVRAMLTGISTLCLVAGVYIVYNTTSTGAAHRAMAMAQLRVIGAQPGVVFRILMTEAFGLGVVGSALGVLYGLGLAYFLSGMIADGFGTIFQLRFPIASLTVVPQREALILASGVAAALFASYFAARRIAQLEPLDIVRREARFSTTSFDHSGRLLVAWALTVGLSIAAFALEVQWKSFEWGNVGSTLWNASIFLIAIPIVSALAVALGRTLPLLFGAEGRVAVDSLRRSPVRAGVTVAAVAFVLGVSTTLASLSLSFQQSVMRFVAQVLGGDLVVSAVTTEGGWLESPIPGRLREDIAAVPGVRTVEYLRVVTGQPYRDDRIGLLALSDGLLDPARSPVGWVRDADPAVALRAVRLGEGVTVSLSFADRFDVRVGESLELQSPTGPITLPIVGLVPDYTANRGTVILSERLFEERWGDTLVNRIIVFLDPGASVQQVRAAIHDRLGDRYRLKIDTLHEAVDYITGAIKHAFAFTDAIQLLIAIVTVAGIFDLLLSAIVERRRELALWRLIGADHRAVRRSVTIESATIGIIGACLGLVVGFTTAWLWVTVNYRYLLGFFLDFHFDFRSAAVSVALIMVMTMIAGYGAAFEATRQSLLEGIQDE
jgi:putative ABC transport system permease protein